MAASGEDEATREAPWLQLDCLTACSSASHFAGLLKAAVAEFAHSSACASRVALPLIRDQDHRGFTKVSCDCPTLGQDACCV